MFDKNPILTTHLISHFRLKHYLTKKEDIVCSAQGDLQVALCVLSLRSQLHQQ